MSCKRGAQIVFTVVGVLVNREESEDEASCPSPLLMNVDWCFEHSEEKLYLWLLLDSKSSSAPFCQCSVSSVKITAHIVCLKGSDISSESFFKKHV